MQVTPPPPQTPSFPPLNIKYTLSMVSWTVWMCPSSRTLFKTVKSVVREDMTWLEQLKINKFSFDKFLGFFFNKISLKVLSYIYISLN